MVKVLFIAGLDHISISADLGRGERFRDTFYITNNNDAVKSLITTEFTEIAGLIEVDFLKKAGAVIYAIEDTKSFANASAAIDYLNIRLAIVRFFLHNLWLIKDNSVNNELGYVEYPYKENHPDISISRNFFPYLYTNNLGTYATVEFSRKELRQARISLGSNVSSIVTLNTQTVAEKINRFSRAVYFLQAARGSSDLGVKIANYSTAFEALFSTDAQELSHKLAERIACFLETDPALRMKVFHEVKRAYSIRSKVVHGAGGSKDMRRTAEVVSTSCDSLLRQVLLKILGESSLQQLFMTTSNEKDMGDYFLSIVLGS